MTAARCDPSLGQSGSVGEVAVRMVSADEPLAPAMAAVLLDCVAGGASVGFLHPFTRDRAEAFWEDALARAAAGERKVFVAEDQGTGEVLGTVQLLLAMPENQPHRGEISKMLVHRRARRRGVGEALLRAAEAAAIDAGKTLLVLDTASAEAERLYERLGWQRAGVIPGYARWPDGGLVDTVIFFKHLDGAEGPR